VVSGINIGDNDTFQDILASGTVAAAIEAAIAGIPAIAYSMLVNEESMFALEYNQPDFSNAAEIAGEIARDVLENGMPEGAEVLNVNFPQRVDTTTKIALTDVGRRKYTDKVMVRKDPRGRPCYWLFGEVLSRFPANTDAEAVIAKGMVSITPIELNLSGPLTQSLGALRLRVEKNLRYAAKRKHSGSKHDPGKT
jgi:5'-nucleotidase